MEFIQLLIPASISASDFWFLVLMSLFTSAITATMGVGGGATLLAIMANILPAAAIIPVHGLVQLGSNAGRLLSMWQHVRWTLTAWFVLGCALGSLIGGQIVVSLPKNWLQLILGLFILAMCWLPLNMSGFKARSGFVLGAVTSFIAMFVGATGTFVISVLKGILPDRHTLIATMAAMMGFQHLIKSVVFGLLGVALHEWLGLIALMILSGFIGTQVGRLALNKLSNEWFAKLIKAVITLLALRLIYAGAVSV